MTTRRFAFLLGLFFVLAGIAGFIPFFAHPESGATLADNVVAAADFATFSAKISLSNLFSLSTTYATNALSTTTPLWLQGRFFSSSTPSLPSMIDNFIANNSTTTTIIRINSIGILR